MRRLKDDMISFISEKEIQEITHILAKQIEKDYAGRDLILICPLKGSLIFVADLIRKIDLPLKVDFVYLTDTEKKGAVKINKDISINVRQKDVLIVEEIIDVGRTLSFLKNRIESSHPNSVKVATLLDKPSRRELPIRPDYCGKVIDDRYVVGYGLDSEEVGRNYRNLYYFKM